MGAWLGTRLMRGKEERQWRRDRCLELYTDFILACDSVAEQADVVVRHTTDSMKLVSDIELLLEKVKEMSRVCTTALLIVPREMIDSIHEIHKQCGIIGNAATYSKLGAADADEWRKIRFTDFPLLTGKFLNDARNDLRIQPPRHMMRDWRKIFRKPN
jgi:hypothetical protein